MYFNVHFDNLHVRFGKREGDDHPEYMVSRLKPGHKGFGLILGRWRREPPSHLEVYRAGSQV